MYAAPAAERSMVGMAGFEPTTSASRTQRSTKLSHIPTSRYDTWSRGRGKPPSGDPYRPLSDAYPTLSDADDARARGRGVSEPTGPGNREAPDRMIRSGASRHIV